MIEVNCSNLESTIESTARVLAIEPSLLRSQLIDGTMDAASVDPTVTPDSAVWFHATRIPRATVFSDGLLPTPTMRPRLLGTLRELALDIDAIAELAWEEMVENLSSAELAWKHSLPAFDDGPHGFLIRESLLASGNYYTDTPEYVRNLCTGFPGDIGSRLLFEYRRRSERALVWFRSCLHREGIVQCALEYARAKLLGQDLDDCQRGFSALGAPVPESDILLVEWLDESPARTS